MRICILFISIILLGCAEKKIQYSQEFLDSLPVVRKATVAPNIDGLGTDAIWRNLAWRSISNLWDGSRPALTDFSGRYKMCWTADKLYVLAQIVDDKAVDLFLGTEEFKNDDALEIMIDADASGGNYTNNYNAFDYHVTIGDYSVINVGKDGQAQFYNDHITVNRQSRETTHIWELAIDLYDDKYKEGKQNQPITLKAGDVLGVALAYNDSDGNMVRESWLGSIALEQEDKSEILSNADLFEKVLLVE